jgi:hypothetical protein
MPDGEAHRPGPAAARGRRSLDVWGFRDSGFVVDDAGHVTFGGARYAISGKRIPRPLPWRGSSGYALIPSTSMSRLTRLPYPNASRIRRFSLPDAPVSRL